MIDIAMGLLASELNRHFRRTLQVPGDLVVLSNLFEPDGGAVAQTINKIAIFLVGMERDTMAHRSPDRTGLGARMQKPGPVFLNLRVMCAVNFSGTNYKEALKYLSSTIRFFQAKPVLDHHNTPELDPGLERLILDIENLNTNELHSLWGIHGNRYLPSVLYRLRMVTLDPDQITAREPIVAQVDVGIQS